MKQLLLMDKKDYSDDMEELCRVSVRAVVLRDGKLLVIESIHGEIKVPGGGMDQGEDDIETLVRETLEETGYHVIAESARPFGIIDEKRLSIKEPMIWHQTSKLYFCDVEEDHREACHYTEKEKKHGFEPKWMSVDEAIEKSEKAGVENGGRLWNKREYNTLKLIKDYIDGKIKVD